MLTAADCLAGCCLLQPLLLLLLFVGCKFLVEPPRITVCVSPGVDKTNGSSVCVASSAAAAAAEVTFIQTAATVAAVEVQTIQEPRGDRDWNCCVGVVRRSLVTVVILDVVVVDIIILYAKQ